MYHSEATDFATNGSGNNLSQVTYANGEFYNMFYDKVGRVEAINNSNYFYDKNGNVMERMPGGFNELGTIYYRYDLAGRVVNKTVAGRWESTVMYALSYKYLNQKNLLEKYRFATTTDDFETSFVYGNMNNGQIADAVYGVKLNNVQKIGYHYDGLARQNQRILYAGNSEITTSYGFKTFDDGSTSYLIDTVTENGYTYSYTYDAVGNITAYTKKNATTNEVVETYVYQYDSKNQLTYVGPDLTSGISYTYDANGNILTKTDHSTNKTITYGYTDPTWADLLTSYNGQTITYDEGGNPLQYNNGTAMELSWIFGRRLFTVNIGDTEIMYAYDQEGIRTSKTIGDAYTKYHIIDGVMYGEKTTDTNGTTEIFYFYDDNDRKYGFSYEGTMYYYQYNLQGDVTGIYDASGQLVVEYKYDAWGKVLSITGSLATTIGQYNPIRYRGYYYDNETGFYYLNSRYYDPETGRFLNADTLLNMKDSVLGYNMFMYCNNNPINMSDPDGHLPFFVITGAVGAVLGAVAGGVIAAKTGKNVWAGIGIGAAGGALLGCGVGAGLGMISGFGAAATASQIGAGLGAIVVGTGAAVSSVAVPSAEKAKQIFWAGGPAASKAADTFANLSRTGSTIANTPIGREIITKTKDIPWEQAKPMWDAASLQFAQQANGIVNVFIYAPNFSSSSIFITTELPALLSNPNVNEIIINIFGG